MSVTDCSKKCPPEYMKPHIALANDYIYIILINSMTICKTNNQNEHGVHRN